MLSDLSSRDTLLGHLAYQKSMMGGMNNMVTGQQGQNKQNHKHITQTSHEDDQNSSRCVQIWHVLMILCLLPMTHFARIEVWGESIWYILIECHIC